MRNSDNIIPFPVKTKITSVKAEKAYVVATNVTVSRKKETPKRTDVKNPLSQEHRKKLRDLVTDWVTTSNLAKKPLVYGKAYSRIYQEALQGEVNGIDQIEESEFEACKRYIHQRIKILETVGNSRVIRCKSEWRNHRIGKIHAICKILGVSDKTRKAYQLWRYRKDSLADFTDDALDHFYGYCIRGTPKFTIPPVQATTLQQDRENALRVMVGVMEANAKAKGQTFNPQRLNFSKLDMFEMLKQREPALFGGMTEEPFNKFWSKQSVCKLKPGKPLGSGTQ